MFPCYHWIVLLGCFTCFWAFIWIFFNLVKILRFSKAFWEKKRLHLYVYIECAYIYQSTSIVDNSSLFLTAQLKPFSMLPFRHMSSSFLSDFYTKKPCHMPFRPVILCLCASNAKKCSFPETSCHIHIWKWYFGTGECVWHCIYQILNSSASLSIGCYQGWKWKQSWGSRGVFLAVMISVEILKMTDIMTKLGNMSSREVVGPEQEGP